jgi:DNA-binding NarL/FixJ family response regulator
MDGAAVTRMTSDDRGSAVKAVGNGSGAASAHVAERAGKLGRREPDGSYALTPRPVGPPVFDCPGLSTRECGILELIGQGYSNKRVARTLGISAETVKSHVKRVFIKLDVNTRAHAVARAQTLGLFGRKFVWSRNVIAIREVHDPVSA